MIQYNYKYCGDTAIEWYSIDGVTVSKVVDGKLEVDEEKVKCLDQ